jgi:hypothetical protein
MTLGGGGGGVLVQCGAGGLGIYCWLVGATRATCHSLPQMLDVHISSRDLLLDSRLLALVTWDLKLLLCSILK